MPVRCAESVIMSIVCLLNSPNCESSANQDAGFQLRENPDLYYKKVRMYTQKTLEDL